MMLQAALLEAAVEAAAKGDGSEDRRSTFVETFCPECENLLLDQRVVLHRVRHLGPLELAGRPGRPWGSSADAAPPRGCRLTDDARPIPATPARLPSEHAGQHAATTAADHAAGEGHRRSTSTAAGSR